MAEKIEKLKAENAELREFLKKGTDTFNILIEKNKLEAENKELKAKVGNQNDWRLTAQSQSKKIIELKAKVEELRGEITILRRPRQR